MHVCQYMYTYHPHYSEIHTTHICSCIYFYTYIDVHTHAPPHPPLTRPSFPSLSLSIRPVRHLLGAVAGSLSQLLTWMHRVSVQLLRSEEPSAQSSLVTSQLALPLPPPLVTTRVQPAWPLCSPAAGSVEAFLKAHPVPSNSCPCCSVHMPWCQPGPRSTCQQVSWEPASRLQSRVRIGHL